MSLSERAKSLMSHLQVVLEKAHAADKKAAEELATLSSQELRVLRAVDNEGCCVMSGLSKAICLSLSSVTGLIDRLVEKKLVRRDRSAEDRRVVQVALTDEGRKAHEAATACCAEMGEDLLTDLSAEEQETLLTLLEKVSRRAKKPA